MIEFTHPGELREMGRRYELKQFNLRTSNYDPVSKLIASVIYRFAMDSACPMVAIRLPEKGDTPIDGVEYLEDVDLNLLLNISADMRDLADKTFGLSDYGLFQMGKNVIVLMKNDFQQGCWDRYDYKLSGVDGISIDRDRRAEKTAQRRINGLG